MKKRRKRRPPAAALLPGLSSLILLPLWYGTKLINCPIPVFFQVSTTTGESIRALVSRLLAKRGLRLTSFDVFSSKEEGKPLDLSEDCALLHCTEVSAPTPTPHQ